MTRLGITVISCSRYAYLYSKDGENWGVDSRDTSEGFAKAVVGTPSQVVAAVLNDFSAQAMDASEAADAVTKKLLGE